MGTYRKEIISIKLLLISFFILLNIESVVSQQILQPIETTTFPIKATSFPVKTTSFDYSPILLERESLIQDLQIVSVEYLDTLPINQVALFYGYIKNISNTIFDAPINLNFDLNQLEDVDLDNIDGCFEDGVDSSIQLPTIAIQPGDSIPFFNIIIIDPEKVDPNTTGVVIIWPEFRVLPTQEEETNYSLKSFYAEGILNEGHFDNIGAKLANDDNNTKAFKNTTFNSFSKLQQYLSEYDNNQTSQVTLFTIDGKVILQQKQMLQYNTISNIMQNSNNKLALLNIELINANNEPELITIKLHQAAF